MNRRELLKKSLEGVVIWIILLMIYSCGKIVDSDSFQSDYYYYKEDGSRLYLKPNLSKYSVKFEDGITDDRKSEILLQNKLNFNLRDFPGYFNIVSFTSSNIDYTNILKNIPEVEFVSCAFETEDGFTVYLTNNFSAKFKSNVSMEEINSFNSKYNAKIIEQWQYGNSEVIYLLEIPWNSVYNIVDMSKIYYESGLVIRSLPKFIGAGEPH